MDFNASNQVTQFFNQLSDSEGILEDSVDFDDEPIDQEQQTQGQDSDFYEIFRPHNYFESLDLIESFLVAVCKSKGFKLKRVRSEHCRRTLKCNCHKCPVFFNLYIAVNGAHCTKKYLVHNHELRPSSNPLFTSNNRAPQFIYRPPPIMMIDPKKEYLDGISDLWRECYDLISNDTNAGYRSYLQTFLKSTITVMKSELKSLETQPTTAVSASTTLNSSCPSDLSTMMISSSSNHNFSSLNSVHNISSAPPMTSSSSLININPPPMLPISTLVPPDKNDSFTDRLLKTSLLLSSNNDLGPSKRMKLDNK